MIIAITITVAVVIWSGATWLAILCEREGGNDESYECATHNDGGEA